MPSQHSTAAAAFLGLFVEPEGLMITPIGRHARADRALCPKSENQVRHRTDCGTEELAALVEDGLLDDLVRPQQQRLRDCQAEGLRGPEVDDQLELRGLLYGKVGGFRSFEDLVHIRRGTTGQVI